MKSLFLGAGASYEVGMPLVWEFSQTLRDYVLNNLNTKLFNFGSDDELKKYFVKIISNPKIHYEEVVGLLEIRNLKERNNQIIHGVIIQLIECIQMLLLQEQEITLGLFSQKIKDYYGIVKLFEKEKIINIFTLNHDVVFEEILNYYKIPYKDGFYKSKNDYQHLANFKTLTLKQLENDDINIFNKFQNGVNLIKLHGSFDVFSIEDGNMFIKAFSEEDNIGSVYNEVKKVEKESINIAQRDSTRVTNELCVCDSFGTLQFLRRSLLSGSHKFKGTFEQIIPHSFLDIFENQLKHTNELVVIGYSFGDSHINNLIQDWLCDKSNTLEIHDPFLKNVPTEYGKNVSQFKIINGGLTDYFMSFDSSKESQLSQSNRNLLTEFREKLKKRREHGLK